MAKLTPAALYMRASSEHQKYSTSHQNAAMRDYARENGYEVVAVYCDENRSGLTTDRREGLIRLLMMVACGTVDFEVLLVYDVSRWGRFQDPDESAAYEYACRRAGIAVVYCAEPFVNDATPMASMVKSMKRAMAAEYSRELSNKVTLAQRRFVLEGYKQGGSAGYGLRRKEISAAGVPKRTLEFGERKSMPTDHVSYVLGPEAEVEVVRRIYAMYIDDKMAEMAIAERLNQEGLRTEAGRHWGAYNVKSILTKEKYAGTIVFNKSTQKLRTSRRPNDRDQWLRYEDAFDGIVSRERFEAALAERRRRRKSWSDDEMLDGLRTILVEHGKVTPELIEATGLPAAKSYAFRFNGLVAAYEAAGVAGCAVSRASITRYRSRCITKDSLVELERCGREAGAIVQRLGYRTYRINGVVARFLCTRCRFERSHACWKVLLTQLPQPDFIIWQRLDESNERVAQVYLLPVADFPHRKVIWPSSRTLPRYEQYARGSIGGLFGLPSGQAPIVDAVPEQDVPRPSI